VRNFPTVGSALRKLTVYQHLNSEGGVPFFLQRGGIVDLGYAIYAPGVNGTGQIYDALMAGGYNSCASCAARGGPHRTFSSRTRSLRTSNRIATTCGHRCVSIPSSARCGFPTTGWIDRSWARIPRGSGSRRARRRRTRHAASAGLPGIALAAAARTDFR
jgi:hypothetical protein